MRKLNFWSHVKVQIEIFQIRKNSQRKQVLVGCKTRGTLNKQIHKKSRYNPSGLETLTFCYQTFALSTHSELMNTCLQGPIPSSPMKKIQICFHFFFFENIKVVWEKLDFNKHYQNSSSPALQCPRGTIFREFRDGRWQWSPTNQT